MNLQEQYQQISQELDTEEYKLHALENQIQASKAVTAQIIASAKKIGRLEERLFNLESYINQRP